LTAVSGRGDTGAKMDVQTEVAAFRQRRRPRVEAHPQANPRVAWPCVLRDTPLCRKRRLEAVPRSFEGGEEGITLRVDDVAAACFDRFSDKSIMV